MASMTGRLNVGTSTSVAEEQNGAKGSLSSLEEIRKEASNRLEAANAEETNQDKAETSEESKGIPKVEAAEESKSTPKVKPKEETPVAPKKSDASSYIDGSAALFWEVNLKTVRDYFPENFDFEFDKIRLDQDDSDDSDDTTGATEAADDTADATDDKKPLKLSAHMIDGPLSWLTLYMDLRWPVAADGKPVNPAYPTSLSLGMLNEIQRIFPVKLSGGFCTILPGVFWNEGAEYFLEIAEHADDEDVCHIALLDYWDRLLDWDQQSELKAKYAYQQGAIYVRSEPGQIVGSMAINGVDTYIFPARFCQELQDFLSKLANRRRRIFRQSRRALQAQKNSGIENAAR